MQTKQTTIGVILIAFIIGGVAGCGGSSSGGSGGSGGADDATVTATSGDADAAYSEASDAITAALTSSQGGALLTKARGGNRKLAQAVDAVKSAITVTSTSSCSEGDVPNPSDNSETVLGSDVFSGGTGSCAVSWDDGTTSFDILADCDSLSDGTDTLDGKLGFAVTVSGNDFSLDVGSQDLTFTYASGVCSLVANISIDVTVNSNGSGSVGASGCLSLCEEAFSVSGSETF